MFLPVVQIWPLCLPQIGWLPLQAAFHLFLFAHHLCFPLIFCFCVSSLPQRPPPRSTPSVPEESLPPQWCLLSLVFSWRTRLPRLLRSPWSGSGSRVTLSTFHHPPSLSLHWQNSLAASRRVSEIQARAKSIENTKDLSTDDTWSIVQLVALGSSPELTWGVGGNNLQDAQMLPPPPAANSWFPVICHSPVACNLSIAALFLSSLVCSW